MADRLPSSPPPTHDAFSPISPMALSPEQHTPKRRRIAESHIPTDNDIQLHHYAFPEDALLYSPIDPHSQNSPPTGSQEYSRATWSANRAWAEMESTDISRRLQDAVLAAPPDFTSMAQQRPANGHPFDFTAHGDFAARALASDWGAFIPPPVPQLYHHRPPFGLSQADFLRSPTSPPYVPAQMQSPGVHVPAHATPPAQSNRRKPGITLTLSRANDDSIAALPEHKRECPACQLDFETDNYLSVISCCGTAMHVNCLSAWVNSATYAKTKICMKCRKVIDARRPMNNMVPPVTDKIWDEGVDFNAPEHVGKETKIELDITGRTDPMHRRYAHMRRDPSYYNRRRPISIVNENDVPASSRPAFQALQRDLRKESEEHKAKYRAARTDWREKFEAEARAAEASSHARELFDAGASGITPREVEGLSQRCREAREEQEAAHTRYRSLNREQDSIDRKHEERLLTFLGESLHQERRALAAASQAQANLQ